MSQAAKAAPTCGNDKRAVLDTLRNMMHAIPLQSQEVTMIAWSQCSSTLAVGTAKGALQLYAAREQRRTPVVGKHTKRVCAGAWSAAGDVLAMAALDKTVSLYISTPAPQRHLPQQPRACRQHRCSDHS